MSDSPLIKWHARADDGNPQTRDDPPNNDHGESTRWASSRSRNQCRAGACCDGADQGSMPTTQEVRKGVGYEYVAEPGAEVVDGGDEALLGGARVMQGLDEARVDQDG